MHPPVLIFQIPIHSFAQIHLEVVFRPSSEFAFNFRAIDGTARIVAGPIHYLCDVILSSADQAIRVEFIDQPAYRFDYFDVTSFIPSSNIVAVTRFAAGKEWNALAEKIALCGEGLRSALWS
jgi:hypothetical protein